MAVRKRFSVKYLRIKEIQGVEFDEILGWTMDPDKATVKYLINGKERLVSIESEAIEVEFANDVSG
ncbi:MAG: hypothetical protein FWF15_03455 [Oscillospiraceae bacterium]|nr:hypothetical protein [Oscillospiraceae bacterium]